MIKPTIALIMAWLGGFAMWLTIYSIMVLTFWEFPINDDLLYIPDVIGICAAVGLFIGCMFAKDGP